MPATDLTRRRHDLPILLAGLLTILIPSVASARWAPAPPSSPDPSILRSVSMPDTLPGPFSRVRGIHRTSPPVNEVYVFVDSLDGRPLDDDAGWDHIDNSEQPTAWHIDSVLACQGKAWWCGRVDSSWIYDTNRAGYGNSWSNYLQNQVRVDSIPLSTPIRISFNQHFDAEPNYDYGVLSVFDPNEGWVDLAAFTGQVPSGGGCDTFSVVVPDTLRQHLVADPTMPVPLVFSFKFTSDIAYSSEDGLYDGDGWVLDNITVSAGSQVLFFDDAENGPGTWNFNTQPGAGDYWRLASNVTTEDRCTTDRGTIWVDFDPVSYSLVPRLDNWLITPPVDIQRANVAFVTFDVYRALPLDNCYYYFCRYRTKNVGDATWSSWVDPTRYIYYGDPKDWARQRIYLTGAGGHDSLEVALALKDFGLIYCNGVSSGYNTYAHFDNVAVGIEATGPPNLSARDADRFQDTFETGPFMGRDDNFNTAVGDSAVVTVDATQGLKSSFMYYRLNGGSFTSVALQPSATALPTSRFADVPAGSYPAGTTLDYYFAATDSQDVTVYYPPDAVNSQTYLSASILPLKTATNPTTGCTDSLAHILFVNNYYGLEPASTFAGDLSAWGFKYDTWNVNAPSSGIGNTLGGSDPNAVPTYYWPQTDVTSLLPYSTIIWHAGDLTSFSLSPQDEQVLQSWLQQPGRNRNLWIAGDNVAYNLGYLGADYNSFLGYTCGVRFIRDLWENTPQDTLHPLVTGPDGSPTAGLGFHVSADCPVIDRFDLVELSSTASLYGKAGAMLYFPNGQPAATRYATRYSGFGQDSSRVLWQSFNMNDIEEGGQRLQLVKDVMENYFKETPCFYASGIGEGSPETGAPAVPDVLMQNAPNPFNPETTIGYSVSRAGRVEIRIYGVRGRLVRRFVTRVNTPGRYSVRWDGRDDSGRQLSSGVYFYEIETEGGFHASRKLIMLK